MSEESTAEGGGGRGWTLVPTMVLRSAGFPFGLMDGLRYHGLHRLTSEIEAARAAAEALCEKEPPPRHLPRKTRARLLGLRTLPEDTPAVDPGWLSAWNAITGPVAGLRERLQTVTEEDEAAVRRSVDEIACDPWVRDAVACSSPAALRGLNVPVSGNRAIRQVASYAQRLAAKSETMSFFGPINYARLAADDPAPSHYTWNGPRELSGREAHPAARVVDALLRALVRDREFVTGLVVRRKTWSGPVSAARARSEAARRILDELAVEPGGAPVERRVRELARACGLEPAEAADTVRDLLDRGLLTHAFCPPATEPRPLEWLRERLRVHRVDHPVRADLDAVAALLRAHPTTPAERKPDVHEEVERVLARHATAAEGVGGPRDTRFYNDRVIVHEAAAGTVDMRVSGELAHDLTRGVVPALDLMAHEAELTRRATNQALAEALGTGRFPLLTVMERCGGLTVRRSHWIGDQVRAASPYPPPTGARGCAPAAPGVHEIDLSELVAPPPAPELPVLCSIDVMPCVADLAEHRAGVTPIVLGDVHDAALLTPWALAFSPDRDRELAERDDLIRRALEDTATVCVIPRRTTGLPPLRFPGPVLELGGTVEGADVQRVGLDELVVHSDGRTATLLHREGGPPLHFHNGELDSGVHTALALPRIRRPRGLDGARGHRLRWKNVVLLRAARRLPSALFTRGTRKPVPVAQQLADFARLRSEHGLPERFFAKSPNERKPVYVDSAAPALLTGLARLAATAEEVELSEVLPDRQDHWLRHGTDTFTSELRCVYLSPGGRR